MTHSLEEWIDASLSRWNKNIQTLEVGDPARLERGYWYFAYEIVGGSISADKLLETVEMARDAKTGWPPFWVPTREEIRPRRVGDCLECWLGKDSRIGDSAHSDFWRVNSNAQAFLIRGYQEDGHEFDKKTHGKYFDLTLPIWRTGECLLQSDKLAEVIDAKNKRVLFNITWTGLRGRELGTLANKRRILNEGYVSQNDKYSVDKDFVSGKLQNNFTNLVSSIIDGLYNNFDLWSVSQDLYGDELKFMLKNRF